MGYLAKAEYTLKLISEPDSYSHLGRRYLVTGFILAPKLKNEVLQSFIEKWGLLDEITSNRIRFLLYCDNEVELTTWPQKPNFSAKSFERHNKDIFALAKQNSLEIQVQPLQQRQISNPRDMEKWRPIGQIEALASRLGLQHLLPCLVWSFSSQPSLICVKQLDDNTDNFIHEVKHFCNAFYRKNRDIILEIEERERLIQEQVGDIDLAISDLEKVNGLDAARAQLQKILLGCSELFSPGISNSHITSQLSEVNDLSIQYINSIATPKDERELFDTQIKLTRKICAYQGKGLELADLNVNRAVDVCLKTIDYINNRPKNAPKIAFQLDEINLPDTSLLLTVSKSSELQHVVNWRQFVEANPGKRLADSTAEEFLIHVFSTFKVASTLQEELSQFGGHGIVERLREYIDSLETRIIYSLGVNALLNTFSWAKVGLEKLEADLQNLGVKGTQTKELSSSSISAVRSSIDEIARLNSMLHTEKPEGYEQLALPASRTIVDDEIMGQDAPNSCVSKLEGLTKRLDNVLIPISVAIRNIENTSSRPSESDLLESIEAKLPRELAATVTTFRAKEVTVNNYNINSRDGEVNIGSNSYSINNSSISNAFNRIENSTVSTDIKEKLQQLAESAKPVIEMLPEKKAKETSEDLVAFIEEATKAEPRKKWYELSSAGLLDAAKAAGEAGTPLINLVGQILPLLPGA